MGTERIDAYGNIKPEKQDTRKNGVCNIEKLRKRDKGKIPLRIDDRTTICVKPCNCNKEYAEAYREKMNKITIIDAK